MFERDLPFYLSIGMPYELYWYGDVWEVKAYREADELRQRRFNSEAWLQGMYFYDAISCSLKNALSKSGTAPAKYPEKPYLVDKDEKTEKEIEREEELDRIKAKLYMKNMVRAGKSWGNKG